MKITKERAQDMLRLSFWMFPCTTCVQPADDASLVKLLDKRKCPSCWLSNEQRIKELVRCSPAVVEWIKKRYLEVVDA